jgi:hypothetical protein
MRRAPVAQAASRRFCAAMAMFGQRRKTKASLCDETLSLHPSLSPRAHKIAGWQPALRFGIFLCA